MKRYLLILSLLFVFIPHATHAARFYLDIPPSASKNEEVLATLKMNTEREVVNAISGEIVLPREVEIAHIYDGGSAVTLWIEKPSFSTSSSTITFSGLTPGGINGDYTLFSFVLKSSVSGTFPLTISRVTALKNDGKGTPVKVTMSPAYIKILSTVSTSTFSITDTTLPEVFIPSITSSKDLFENQAFVSFLAQDKGQGIDHYEYAATFFGSPGNDSWIDVESPFVLPKEALSKKVFIKAVDKSGNMRVVSIAGPSYYANMGSWSIIIVLLILCVLFFSKRFLP